MGKYFFPKSTGHILVFFNHKAHENKLVLKLITNFWYEEINNDYL